MTDTLFLDIFRDLKITKGPKKQPNNVTFSVIFGGNVIKNQLIYNQNNGSTPLIQRLFHNLNQP